MSDTESAAAEGDTQDDNDHDHDHGEHDHEPTEAEVALARARVERLSATLDAIPLSDLDAYLKRAGLQVRNAVAGRLALRLDPKFLKGGIGRLVRARIRKLPAHAKLELAADLTAPIDTATSEFLGDSYESPSAEQLDALVAQLVESFPASIVRSYLSVTAAAQAEAAEELDRMLEDDPRLALAGEPSGDG